MDVMDEALELLEDCGPEYGPGFSSHGPMAAEALLALGRGDAVVDWVTAYRRRLRGNPSPGLPVFSGYWFEALGSAGRYADWVSCFEEELREEHWCTVLNVWVPRLLPGMVGAAWHGAIRTGHAVRSLNREESPAKIRELARALAYWAARYQSLPGFPLPDAETRNPLAAIDRVPSLPDGQRLTEGLIYEKVRRLSGFAPFEPVINLTAPPEGISLFAVDLLEAFVRVYLANAKTRGSVITFIHGVTGPGAVCLMATSLLPDISRVALRYAWQASAALYAAIGREIDRAPYDAYDEPTEDLVARAVATGDEHAVKFTEVCLRAHRMDPRPVFLVAARHAVDMLGRPAQDRAAKRKG
ncbi:MAG: DUF4243 domain-containing protein [Syntrophaceae bacterium]|nr:DUF4243 domain-containing protein [Syntrophaceae bacterium]